MAKIDVIGSEKLKLVKVNKSKLHAKILYKILDNRDTKDSISHTSKPSLEAHIKFINSLPYRHWFIIKRKSEILGSVYVTDNNEISINLLKKNKKNFNETLNMIITNIKPLPGIPSRRSKQFILNLSPSNKYHIKLLHDFGAKKIQETYLIKNK